MRLATGRPENCALDQNSRISGAAGAPASVAWPVMKDAVAAEAVEAEMLMATPVTAWPTATWTADGEPAAPNTPESSPASGAPLALTSTNAPK